MACQFESGRGYQMANEARPSNSAKFASKEKSSGHNAVKPGTTIKLRHWWEIIERPHKKDSSPKHDYKLLTCLTYYGVIDVYTRVHSKTNPSRLA